MRYKLSTLVDITNTGSRRGDDPIAYRQNQNYLTVIQTLGLRTNVEFISLKVTQLDTTNFGSKYKGKKKVWEFVFEIEREGYHSLEDMESDFDLVPFVAGLDEDVKFDKSLFHTTDLSNKNIFFELL